MARLAPLRDTTPISNFVQSFEGLREMLKESLPAYEAVREAGYGRNLVKFTQSRLGKQTRTFVGEFRYYLWEYPNYTLWVANGKGFEVEVLPTLTPEEAMIAYRGAFALLILGA